MADVAGRRRVCGWLSRVLFGLVLMSALTARAAGLPDADNDTKLDGDDNCINVANADQADTDGDGVGDACDMCPGTKADVPNGLGALRLAVDSLGCALTQLCPCHGPMMGKAPWRHRSGYVRCLYRQTKRLDHVRVIHGRERSALIIQGKRLKCGLAKGVPGDRDGDGILDDSDRDGIAGNHPCKSRETVRCDDNCPGRRNRDQVDMDGNGRGNRCDPDIDGDKVKNRKDNCPRAANPSQEDGDKDGVGDACDDCKDSDDNADVDSKGCG